MAIPYVNLPAARVPRNAMLDFAPINEGIDAYQRAGQQKFQNELLAEQRNMQKDQIAYDRGRDAKQDMRQTVADIGKAAAAGMRLTDPAQKAAVLKRIMAQHPDAANLGPEYQDPGKALEMIAAEAGQWRDPMEDQARQLDMDYKRAQIGSLNRRAEPDPIEQMLIQRLQARGAPQQQPAQPPNGLLQKQSFDGGGAPDGLQLVADGQPSAPASGPVATDQVDTPYGPMTREEAMQMGGAMLLSPKYSAAGKALLDAAQSGKMEGLAKPTVNDIEQRTVNAAASLARLSDVEAKFDPKFLEIPTRLKMMGASWSAKAGESLGGKLSPEQRKEMGRYAQFRSSAANNLNTTLKELSGAAVTPQEAERLLADIPNPGSGVFDGDDPVTFDAKQKRAIMGQRAAIARYNFMRSRGLMFDKNSLDQFMALDDVPAAIDRRGAEIEAQLKKSGADANTIDQQVRKKLKQEFGI